MLAGRFGVNCQVGGGIENGERVYEMVMRPPFARSFFHLNAGKMLNPDLAQTRRHSDRVATGLSSLWPSRELHVRKRRCFDAINAIRLGRCRCPDPKISAEPSAKNEGSRDVQMFNP